MRALKNLVLLLLCLNFTIAQGQLLDKKITVSYQETSLEYILSDLKSNHGIRISYSNNQIQINKKYTLIIDNGTVKSLLDALFKDSNISYEVVGKNIVLRKKEPKTVQTKEVAPASINERYELEEIKSLSASTLAAQPMEMSKMEWNKEYLVEKRKLLIAYDNKEDSIRANSPKASEKELRTKIRLLMKEFRKELIAMKDSLATQEIKWTKHRSKLPTPLADTNTTSDTNQGLQKDWQVSFVPPLSSNGTRNSDYTNKLSLNIIAGYAGGLKGVELGSLANIERQTVEGVQFAGVANLVKGNVKGIQFAGTANITGASVKGIQYASSLNICSGNLYGIQFAGGMNAANRYTSGAQFAGGVNIINDSSVALQAAGGVNLLNGNSYGTQLSGIANIAHGKYTGTQATGILNLTTDTLYGSQLAGVVNINTESVRGVQISGVFNIARKIRGSQIGLINIADTITGVQIGLISFAKNGYRRFEVYGGEALYGNVAFKMGTQHFYNIFAAGVTPHAQGWTWATGYGIGSDFQIGKKSNMNIDLLCYQVNENGKMTHLLNLLNQASINFSFLIGNQTRLFVGPVFNIKVYRKPNNDGTVGSEMVSWNLYDKTVSNTNVMIWPGIHGGIRF